MEILFKKKHLEFEEGKEYEVPDDIAKYLIIMKVAQQSKGDKKSILNTKEEKFKRQTK